MYKRYLATGKAKIPHEETESTGTATSSGQSLCFGAAGRCLVVLENEVTSFLGKFMLSKSPIYYNIQCWTKESFGILTVDV